MDAKLSTLARFRLWLRNKRNFHLFFILAAGSLLLVAYAGHPRRPVAVGPTWHQGNWGGGFTLTLDPDGRYETHTWYGCLAVPYGYSWGEWFEQEGRITLLPRQQNGKKNGNWHLMKVDQHGETVLVSPEALDNPSCRQADQTIAGRCALTQGERR